MLSSGLATQFWDRAVPIWSLHREYTHHWEPGSGRMWYCTVNSLPEQLFPALSVSYCPDRPKLDQQIQGQGTHPIRAHSSSLDSVVTVIKIFWSPCRLNLLKDKGVQLHCRHLPPLDRRGLLFQFPPCPLKNGLDSFMLLPQLSVQSGNIR